MASGSGSDILASHLPFFIVPGNSKLSRWSISSCLACESTQLEPFSRQIMKQKFIWGKWSHISSSIRGRSLFQVWVLAKSSLVAESQTIFLFSS
jgi:hypothetical protein